ncbi:MAG TPA: hypothetical protein VEJ36_06025 [Nitrososphaerales archaeon]|nr:hypothetical protein [Nitrososphaerales archaeon]
MTKSKKDVSLRTAQMVRLLAEIGPDIPEIARRLGQFKESVRYRYKQKILNGGFAVQAAPNYEKLGLKRVIMIVDFNNDFRPFATSILTAMTKLCYVVSFEKTLPRGEYVVQAAVAAPFVNEYIGFIHELKSKGIFSSVEALEFDWYRNSPMKADYYDFDHGRWDFDWSSVQGTDASAASLVLSEPVKFDTVDLEIIKELQADANKSLKEISKNINVNYKKLAWHYSTHVIGRGMIRNYRVNWMGTTYDFDAEKARQRQHRYYMCALFVKYVDEVEKMTLRQRLSRLPFLWAEAAGSNFYAELAFPVETVTEAFQYLETAILPVREKSEILTIDQSNAIAFSVPWEMYSSDKGWTFNRAALTAQFENLILEIRRAGSAQAK